MEINMIYISGPITGCDDFQVRFAKAQAELEKRGQKVVNPALLPLVMPGATYDQYMSIDLALMDMCSAVRMLNGWEQSHGATMEYGYAMGKDMIILFEKDLGEWKCTTQQ